MWPCQVVGWVNISRRVLARRNYATLPAAFGCERWFVARVTTCEEFDEALRQAETADTGVYIEVVTDAHAASPLALKLHDAMQTLYAP